MAENIHRKHAKKNEVCHFAVLEQLMPPALKEKDALKNRSRQPLIIRE